MSQVVSALSRLGYSVDVLTYPMGRGLEVPGVSLVRIPNPFGFRSVPVGLSVQKLVLDALLVPAIWWRLRTRAYACIHAVEEAAFPAAYFARSRSVPVIYDMQSSLPEQLTKYRVLRSAPAQAVLRRCERWLLKRVDWVISSSGLAELVHGTAPGTRHREWAFVGEAANPPAAEVARLRSALGIGPNTRVVLYTGTFEEYQGLPALVSAVPLVRSAVPDTVFVLVGAGDADPIPLGGGYRPGREAVRIVPRQPRERIPAFLALADVVVSPRAYGGNIPLKIFDYLAAGRPIVATDLPTHRSILNEERAELVPATAEGFAEAIVRLLQDPDHARRLADAGSLYAREHLSWDSFDRRVQEVYDAACGAAPKPAELA